MSFPPLVAANLELQLATLERQLVAPTGALGYGRDLSCVSDCTQYFADVDPFSARGIAEAIVRRLTTPRGALIDDPDYGLDLRAYCNRGTPEQELWALQQHAINECTKDERVDRAQVQLTLDFRTRRLDVKVRITPADQRVGAFDFVFSVVDGTVLQDLIGG